MNPADSPRAPVVVPVSAGAQTRSVRATGCGLRTCRRLLAALMGLCAMPVLAHGGALNAEGCHMNRKTGVYHCHRASAETEPTAGAASGAGGSPRGTAAARAETASPAAGPTCHVGPRGGTYTITKSGKKNYRGC